MSLRDQLTAAQNLIRDPDHWTQGVYYDGPTCFCIAGAIREVRPQHPYPLFDLLAKQIGDRPGEAEGQIICWNDDSIRTHTEVMELFDRAIAKCED